MESRRIAVTSPAGVWDHNSLIGASVHIKSLPVSSLFSFDDSKIYTISDIKFRLNSYGKCISSIHLNGVDKVFAWKDLEVTGLDLTLYKDSICGEFCCGQSICGYGQGLYGRTEDEIKKSTTDDGNTIIVIDNGDGPELD